MEKTITPNQYYHALALFIVAHRKQQEVSQLETEMNQILMDDNGSHVSDAIYAEAWNNEKAAFDEALEKMKIKVEPTGNDQ